MDPRSLVVVAHTRGLGGMQSDPDPGREPVVAAVIGERPLDRSRAGERRASIRERHEETVTGVVDLLALVAREAAAQGVVVPVEEVVPRFVPDRLDQRGGSHDVGEHERADLAGPRGGRGSGQEGVRPSRIGRRPEPLERGPGRLEVERGRFPLPRGRSRLREQHRGDRRFVGRVDLPPEAPSLAEPLDRLGGVIAEERGEPSGVRRRRPDRRRPELLGDHLELRRVGLRGGEIAQDLRDLRLRGEQPGSRELVPRDLLEAALDRGRRGVRATSSQEQERLPRLRLRSERLGLPEGVLRALEVAHAEPDLAELMERLSRHRGMEALQLVRCPLRLRGGVGPGAGEPHELGPMDAADPREAADVLPFTPALRHVRPLAAPPIVRGLATHRHHRAEHGAGRERTELAAHGDRRGPLHQAERLVELSGSPQHLRAADRDPDGQVGVVQPRGDLLRAIQMRERSLEVPAIEVELTVCDLEVAVRDGLRLTLEEVLGAVQPRLGHGAGHLRPVLPAKRERHHRGHRAVPSLQVERVGALERRDRLRREPDPPGGLRERLEILRVEPATAIRLEEEPVGLGPGPTRVRLASCLQRIDGHDIAHPHILSHGDP